MTTLIESQDLGKNAKIETGNMNYVYDDDGRDQINRVYLKGYYGKSKESNSWWREIGKSSMGGSEEFSFLALPYFLFFQIAMDMDLT